MGTIQGVWIAQSASSPSAWHALWTSLPGMDGSDGCWWEDDRLVLALGASGAPDELSALAASGCGRFAVLLDGHAVLKGPCASAGGGPSTAEQVAAAVAVHGLHLVIECLHGPFVLVVWDRCRQHLTLTCDRSGHRTLYYGWHEEGPWFSSRLAALQGCHQRPLAVQSLRRYLSEGHVSAPYCLVDGMYKLKPGHYVQLGLVHVMAGASAHRPQRQQQAYWSAERQFLCAMDERARGRSPPLRRCMDLLEMALHRSIELLQKPAGQVQLLVDDPASAVLAAIAQSQSRTPLPMLTTVGCGDSAAFGHWAAALARRLGGHHEVLAMESMQVEEMLPGLLHQCDEPNADARTLARQLVCLQPGVRRDRLLEGSGSEGALLQPWQGQAGSLRTLLPCIFASGAEGGVGWLLAGDRATRWPMSLMRTVQGVRWPHREAVGDAGVPARMKAEERALYLQYCRQPPRMLDLPMDVAVPWRDSVVLEHAWRVPQRLPQGQLAGPWMVQQLLAQHVPMALATTCMQAPGVPMGSLLRGALHDWARSQLAADAASSQPLFDAVAVTWLWRQVQNGGAYWEVLLWRIVVLLGWRSA